jgi:hypothetical protein
MLSATKLSKATNPQLIALIKQRNHTGYFTKLIRDELRSRILLTRKYSGDLT